MKLPSYISTSLKKKIFVLTQSNNFTDKNGEILIKILIKSNYVGIYAMNFYCEGGISEPIQFQTEFPPNQIYIKNQTFYNFTLMNSTNKSEIHSKYLRSGDFIPPVRII